MKIISWDEVLFGKTWRFYSRDGRVFKLLIGEDDKTYQDYKSGQDEYLKFLLKIEEKSEKDKDIAENCFKNELINNPDNIFKNIKLMFNGHYGRGAADFAVQKLYHKTNDLIYIFFIAALENGCSRDRMFKIIKEYDGYLNDNLAPKIKEFLDSFFKERIKE